ncbi:DUF6457 domain-containing protein [Streptomyces sp. NPDC048639]|uniref:DUF6457 domain-containing protein n=1 Tax=Streptomyces sp. NPDC048639 TaxID=3365581 RepID=UPI0037129A0A
MTAHAYDAVVLAGGAAKRLGGADKPGLSVGGRPLLDRVLGACADAAVTVVVGSRRPTVRAVRWAREEPPGAGPLAALDAGLRQVTAPVVLALSADLPFLSADTVRVLLAELDRPVRTGADASAVAPLEGAGPGEGAGRTGSPGSAGGPGSPASAGGPGSARSQDGAGSARSQDGAGSRGATGRGSGAHDGGPAEGHDGRPVEGVVLVDADGRDQPLVAAYRTEPLCRELALLAAEHGSLAHLPLRLLTSELTLHRLPGHDAAASFDCDTWEDVAAARARIREHGNVLDEWIAAVKADLGIELDVDTGLLLDLARDAAHGVARPAAPLTTFLVGYAAARAGGSPDEVAAAARKAAALAARWAEEAGDGPAGGPEKTTG